MKNWIWIIVPICLGCNTILKVYSDYDRSYDLRTFKTYQWAEVHELESKNNPLYFNELTDKRIKSISDKQLKLKGFSLVDDKPDVIIHYHIMVNDRYSLSSDPYGLYGSYWTRPGGNTILYMYKEGILIIDMMDSKSNNLVWRGYAVSVLEDDEEEISELTLNKAIARILQRYERYD